MKNQKKLSIVFVTNNYTPYQGGVVSSITQHIDALRNEGHNVILITLDFVQQTVIEPHVIRLYCPIRFTYKSNPMAIPWCPSYFIHKILKEIKPDVIHAHHPFLLGNAALKAAKKLNIPILFTYHTLYDHYLHYIPLPQTLTRPIVNKLVRFFCTQVDGIIAPSRAVKEHIDSCTILTKTEIIPSAISPHFFTNNATSTTRQSKTFNLLTVSRFTKEKNIYFLLDVFALLNLKNVTFTLAGYGSEYASLKHYAYGLKKLSPEQVHFIEKPSKQTLLTLYQQANLFIFASKSETQGLVLAEAMAQRAPVVALDGPGQRDVVQNDLNGYLVKNQEEMKHAIQKIATNPTLEMFLQHNAFATAKKYSVDTLIDQLLSFYRLILLSKKT